MKIDELVIAIKEKSQIKDIAYSKKQSNLIYAITKDLFLLIIDIEKKQVIKKEKIDIDFRIKNKVKLYLSDNDKYFAVVNEFGRYGFIYNMKKNKTVLILDRKDYHTEKSQFPIYFFEENNKTFLIHADNWNLLNITDVENSKVITSRNFPKEEEENYLDYFYGKLYLSPNKKWLLSSGWVWSPISVIKVIDFKTWFSTNKNEPEIPSGKNFSRDIVIASYYWDRTLAWINDKTIAYLYDPKEEELDDEEYQEMGVEKDKGYIMFYDVSCGKIVKKIEFDYFSRNKYYEPTEDCHLFCCNLLDNKKTLVISSQLGIFFIDQITGQIIDKKFNIYLNDFSKKFNVFYNLLSNNKIQLLKFE